MRINLFGQRNPLGGGRHYGEFADALRSLRVISDAVTEFDYFSTDDYRRCLETVGPDDINIHFVDTTSLPEGILPQRWPVLPGINIHWAIFEATKLPTKRIEWLRSANLIFVPSSWGKSVLIDHGIAEEQIEVVPEGVNPAKLHPLIRSSYKSYQDDIYRVLVVSKFEERKGFPELLEGYAKAFGSDPAAKLLLKSDSLYMMSHPGDAYQNNIAELQGLVEQAGIKNATYLNGVLSDDDLAHLYNACDVLLFPSRAEGWGLPLIEAIATGMPVATTFFSGHTEFLAPIKDKVGLLEHRMIPMGHEGSQGDWACADSDTIAARLIEMRENSAAYNTKALEASAIIRRDFTWQRAAEKGVGIILERFGLFDITIEI